MSPSEFPAPERATRVRWRICFFLLLAVALSFLDRLNFSIAAKPLQENFGISDLQLGLIFSSFGVGYALFQIPGGMLGDLFGPRRVLALTMAFWSLLTAVTGWMNHIWAFAAVRFLIGASEAPTLTNANRVVATWMPMSERARGNGIFVMGVGLGGVLTPPFVAWLLAVCGWRWMFVVCAAIGLALVAAWILYSTETPEQHGRVNTAELEIIRQGSPSKARVAQVRWKNMLSSGNVWLLALSYLLVGYTTYVFYTWFYLYVVRVRHLPAVEASVWSSAPFLAFGVMSFLGGAASDRAVKLLGRKWGRRVCVQIGTFGAAIVLVVGSRLENPYWAVCILSLGAGFNAFATVSWWATSIDVSREYSGSLSGLMNMAGNIGGTISPTLTPWIATHFGWVTAIDVAAATIGASGLVWFFVDAEKPLVIAHHAEEGRSTA